MNQYTIINIDSNYNSVSLHLEYNGNEKDVLIYLSTVNDAQLISDSCDTQYQAYILEIDNAPKLGKDVASLIGIIRSQEDILLATPLIKK